MKSQSIYNKIVLVETELAKSKRLNNYYNYLDKYLKEGNALDRISIPTSFGVEDPALNLLVKQLIDIQLKKNTLVDGGQINNPAISQYNRQTKQLLLNLEDNIKISKSANNVVISDLNLRINQLEKSLNDIPKVERELLNIERLQSISENIYVFLLKKRAEAKITSSSVS